MKIEDLKQLWKYVSEHCSYSFPWQWLSCLFAIAIFIIIYSFILFPEKGEKWIALLTRLFAWASKKADRSYVAHDICSVLNTFRKQINLQIKGLIPYPVRIQWLTVKDVEESAFASNNELVILLRYHPNEDNNLVTSVLHFLAKGVLVHSRQYIDRSLVKCLDISFARDILVNENRTTAIALLHEVVTEPTIAAEPQVADYSLSIDKLKNMGYFERIFLNELMEMGRRLFPSTSTHRIHKETVLFLQFLDNIASKQRGEDVNLAFQKDEIRASVILVAKGDTVDTHGIKPYVKRAVRDLDSDKNTVYLCALGPENIECIRNTATAIGKKVETMQSVFDYRLRESAVPAILITLTKNRDTFNYLNDKISSIVPEISDGTIELLAVARENGHGTKIAVRYVDGTEDPILFVRGKDGKRIKAIGRELGEHVDTIRWDDDPRIYIKNALLPACIAYVEIDENMREATAFVSDKYDYRRAIGWSGTNVRLAAKLTGWDIVISVLPS